MKKDELDKCLRKIGIKIKKEDIKDKKLEEILEKYYGKEIPFNSYFNTRNYLMRLLIENQFPTIEQWNHIAEREGYLSHISIEYITGCNWKVLRKKLYQEIKEIAL